MQPPWSAAQMGRVMRPARNDTKVTIPSLVYAKWQPAVKMVEHSAPTLRISKVARSGDRPKKWQKIARRHAESNG